MARELAQGPLLVALLLTRLDVVVAATTVACVVQKIVMSLPKLPSVDVLPGAGTQVVDRG